MRDAAWRARGRGVTCAHVPRIQLVRLLPSLLLVAACGSGDDAPADIDAGYDCEVEMRDEEFTAGMEKTGTKGLTFRLVSSDPAPPERGDNAWVIDIVNGDGPVDDGHVEITTFMPDHQHNGSLDDVAEVDATEPGRYSHDEVNMWMPGMWETTIEATPAGGTNPTDTDFVVFRFCLAR